MARMRGRDLSLFTIGGSALLAVIRQCEIERSFDTQENRALQDAFHYNVPIIEDWRITFTIADDTTFMDTLMGAVGTTVALSVTSSSGGTAYTGSGVLQRGRHTIPDGLQEGAFEIVPQSTLSIA